MARRYGAINEFQSLMSRADGFARPTRYQVMLTAPAPLGLPHHAREISLLCDTIIMPGHDLQTHSAKYGTGIATEMVTGHGYEGTIEATFYCDVEMGIKTYFELWQEQAISTTRNTVRYYKDDEGRPNYAGTMKIYQLSSIPVTETTLIKEDTSGGSGDHRTSKNKSGMVEEKLHTHETIRKYGIEVEDVYPATIGQIEYAYATVDAVAILPVSFQYRRWQEIDLAEAGHGPE
jgi:hypothetical protein